MIRQRYLSAATVATTLVADPAVARSWEAPSALRKFRVSGLAGHLASQITQVPPALDAQPPGTPPVSSLEHYRRSTWTDGDIDSELNAGIRYSGDQSAAVGPARLSEQAGHSTSCAAGPSPDTGPPRYFAPSAGPNARPPGSRPSERVSATSSRPVVYARNACAIVAPCAGRSSTVHGRVTTGRKSDCVE